MKCDICGEGKTHLVCYINEVTINSVENILLGHAPIYEDVPVYLHECDECGLFTQTDMMICINSAIYKFSRREHNLPDSPITRKWKET